MATTCNDVESYIGSFPPEVQAILNTVRERVMTLRPDLGEKISYQIPTVTLGGKSLVYYAGWKHHLGMYPVPVMDPAFEAEIGPYRAKTDTLQFKYKQPIPYDLIERIVAELLDRRSPG